MLVTICVLFSGTVRHRNFTLKCLKNVLDLITITSASKKENVFVSLQNRTSVYPLCIATKAARSTSCTDVQIVCRTHVFRL